VADPESPSTDPLARVDPNTAALAELQTLPGVGPALAARIAAARPFRDAEDLRRVPGIGPAALDAMRDRLTFEVAAGTAEPAAAGAEEFVREASERVEEAFESAGARWATATGGRRLLVDVGLVGVAVILSMCLTLSVLAGINRSLDVSRQPTVRQLVSDVAGLGARLDALQSRADSFEGRLSALEGLTGRMNAVESEVERMQTALDQAATEVAAMRSTVEAVSGEVAGLRTEVDRIDSFLRGVQDLFKSLYPEVPPVPEATPAS
jgi:competence ComEA-like helix-hairpin-helix protein